MSIPRLPQPRPEILDITPYEGGRARAPGAVQIYKLSSNESALGTSPKALTAYEAAAGKLAIYPDGHARALHDAIAARFGLDARRVICGAGSDEILSLLAHGYLGSGTEAIHTEHAFSIYRIFARAAGGTPVSVPEKDRKADVDGILKAVNDTTRIVFIANPNNPTGTYLNAAEMRRLHEALPGHVLLVVDAAYAEYVRQGNYEPGLELAAAAENVVVTRTFSKIYGLASLRLGWAFCPLAVADVFNRLRGPFNINGAAQAAGIAALEDREFIEKAVTYNEIWRGWLERHLKRLGLHVTPGAANFLLIDFPQQKGKTAADADDFLMQRGLILRRMEGYGFPDSLRLTVGPEQANRLLIEALEEFLAR
jgi:histidinol-phosphate aminotransferase